MTGARVSGAASRRIDTQALKDERPLEDVVAAFGVTPRRGGVGRYWALCPFHQERTPSFCVDVRDRATSHFHCFGCSAHGDVIDFVMQREGCSFAEACEHLSIRGRPLRSSPYAGCRHGALAGDGRKSHRSRQRLASWSWRRRYLRRGSRRAHVSTLSLSGTKFVTLRLLCG